MKMIAQTSDPYNVGDWEILWNPCCFLISYLCPAVILPKCAHAFKLLVCLIYRNMRLIILEKPGYKINLYMKWYFFLQKENPIERSCGGRKHEVIQRTKRWKWVETRNQRKIILVVEWKWIASDSMQGCRVFIKNCHRQSACYSKCSLWTSRNSTTWKPGRSAESQTLFQTYRIRSGFRKEKVYISHWQ